MITRSQAGHEPDDKSNCITPGIDGHQGYNLRPRKKNVTKTNDENATNCQRGSTSGKKIAAKKKKNQAASAKSKELAVLAEATAGSSGNDSSIMTSMVPYQYSAPADDIDGRDVDDPQCASAYVQDIYENLRSKESSPASRMRPDYMKDQVEINEHMRMILVDWMVDVHLKFKFVPDTLYLNINIIDRYLATNTQVPKAKLQLVGVTALLIASKYEEIWPVALADCSYICDLSYGRQDILEMEEDILKALKYRVTMPSAHVFLMRYLKAGHADRGLVQLSCFILDGTLQSYYLLNFLPSQLAAAAVFIARKTVGRNPWSPTLLKYTQYREEDVLPVARAVMAVKTYCSAGLHAVDAKYARTRYGRVSHIPLATDF